MQKRHVEEKVVTSDYHLLRVLVAHAEKKSAQIRQRQGFASTIKRSILNMAELEYPTIEQVAGHLHTSPRTLQKRLKEEGYTFQQLSDELKKELALSYLEQRDLSITEIAYLLNYNDNSAFPVLLRGGWGYLPTPTE